MWVSVVLMAEVRVGLGALSLAPKRRFMVGDLEGRLVDFYGADDVVLSVEVEIPKYGCLGYLPAVTVSMPSPPRWAASIRSDSGLLLRGILWTHVFREIETGSGVNVRNHCSCFAMLGFQLSIFPKPRGRPRD